LKAAVFLRICVIDRNRPVRLKQLCALSTYKHDISLFLSKLRRQSL